MRRFPTNRDDIIDVRDIDSAIESLQNLMDDDFDVEEKEDLENLLSLRNQLHNDTELLIRESYFVEYAKELAEDIGAIDRNANWPLDCIDWEDAAGELEQDYFHVEFAGVIYLAR